MLWISSGFTSKQQTRLERPGAYPLVEQMKGAPLEKDVALPGKHQTRLERPAKDKHSVSSLV